MALAASAWQANTGRGDSEREVHLQQKTAAAGAQATPKEQDSVQVLWHDEKFVSVVPLKPLENGSSSMSDGNNVELAAFDIRADSKSSSGLGLDAESSGEQQDNLRVLVVENDDSWVPSGGVSACDGGWKEMSAAKGLETNSYSCYFSDDIAAQMLRKFLQATLPALRSAFGIARCEHRDAVGLPRKAFTTLLSRFDCK